MENHNTNSHSRPMFGSADDVSLPHLDQLCRQEITQADYPIASENSNNILIYDGDVLRSMIEQGQHKACTREMALGLNTGPGIVVIRSCYADLSVIDRMNKVFDALFEDQKRSATASDHFAEAGENSRIWNAFQKSARKSPDDFIDYYKNPVLRLVCEAWLGPHYQLTAQVNVVHPGGRSQHPHRDYHLGFQDNDEVARYPLHAQVMSQFLTLQGAVAHSDMPVNSGPTMLLPYSHQYPLGYLAWRKTDFKQYFEQNAVQLPLQKGDALFFTPALFHGAGSNNTADRHRIANLLQISSTFAKPMETINLYRVIRHIYPALLTRLDTISTNELTALLMVACDGYSFPSNLDTDPPVDGMAPVTMERLTHTALAKRWTPAHFSQQLQAHFEKRQA